MRKADYAALAAIIARVRREADAEMAATERADGPGWDCAFARRGAANEVAHAFAAAASVDRVAFLQACGIAP